VCGKGRDGCPVLVRRMKNGELKSFMWKSKIPSGGKGEQRTVRKIVHIGSWMVRQEKVSKEVFPVHYVLPGNKGPLLGQKNGCILVAK
jgi:hypothetical protein